jgi:hypothetical protein
MQQKSNPLFLAEKKKKKRKEIGESRREAHCWAWWCTPVIPVLRELRQEDLELGASLGYIERPVSKNKKFRNNW